MSDFDKFFKDKLEEEQTFPRGNRNWKSVSKRLDAFDMGGNTGHTYIRYWQALAAAACLTVGLLAWKLVSVQENNAKLEQQIAQLKTDKPADSSTAITPGSTQNILPGPHSNASGKDITTPASKSGGPTGDITQNTDNQIVKNGYTHTLTSSKQTNDDKQQMPDVIKTQSQASTASQKKTVDAKAEKEEIKKESLASDATSRQNDNTPALSIPGAVTLDKSDSIGITASASVGDSTLQNTVSNPETTDAITSTATDSMATAMTTPTAVDSMTTAMATPVQDDTLAVVKKEIPAPGEAEVKPDTVAATAAASKPMIKPERSYNRLRAGVQFLAGSAIPSEKGVSILTGQGIVAGWRCWKDLSLTASADWLRFDLNTTEFIQRFHPHHMEPDPHGGGGGQYPDDELVQVESTQRQRQLSLGIQYAVPIHFWVRPTFKVSHSWTHIASHLISYKFEEQQHGGGPHNDPETRYLVEKTNAQNLDNIWLFGVGLQRETKRWVFSLGADYSKDFASSDALFGNVVFKAGLQYKLL